MASRYGNTDDPQIAPIFADLEKEVFERQDEQDSRDGGTTS
jgi:hypothetical protein